VRLSRVSALRRQGRRERRRQLRMRQAVTAAPTFRPLKFPSPDVERGEGGGVWSLASLSVLLSGAGTASTASPPFSPAALARNRLVLGWGRGVKCRRPLKISPAGSWWLLDTTWRRPFPLVRD
jgi:hypothetical protein